MIAGMTYYQIASYFLIYSFLGWCTEVVYQALKRGKVMNRGFLNGPLCPVYGFGVLAVFSLTGEWLPVLSARSPEGGRLSGLLYLFLIGMAMTTLIELVAGWLLDVCFHARWWDYSNVRLNFHGYVCLPFSIIWGLAVVFVVRVLQPAMESERGLHLPQRWGWPVLMVLYAVVLADFVVSVLMIAGINRRLTELDQIQKKMRIVSDGLSRTLGSNTIEAHQKFDEGRVQAYLAGAEMKNRQTENLEKLRARKDALEEQLRSRMSHSWYGAGRILKAFPELKHRKYDLTLKSLFAGVVGRLSDPSADASEKN